jgi:hypothetical protein
MRVTRIIGITCILRAILGRSVRVNFDASGSVSYMISALALFRFVNMRDNDR